MASLCLLSTASGADGGACRPGCGATNPGGPARLFGIDYAGTPTARIEHLRHDDLLGSLKMSGTWVSKLPVDQFTGTAVRICKFAAERKQGFYLQLPTTYASKDLVAALDQLAARGCTPQGFAIGNEVDRLVTERIVARYSVADYIADYNRMVPLVTQRFPAAKIIALELASFAVKEYAESDPVAAKYKPVFDWLLPFAKATLVRKPDYLSVHYYPFTGGQKEWETLAGGRMFRHILRELAPHLAGLPPVLIGEFNATYQYEDDTVYPDSGGDSFMAALTVPAMLATDGIAGFFHWSLVEPTPSTLGLYQGNKLAPAPLFHAYRLLADVFDRHPVTLVATRPHIDAHAFLGKGSYRLALANMSPFFQRNIVVADTADAGVRASFCDCKVAPETVTLAPLSLTVLEKGVPARRLAYADRVVRSGEFSGVERTRPYCAPLANFSQKAMAGMHFENRRFNQNAKIGTGGTPVTLSSPGGKTSVRKDATTLTVDCALPGTGPNYHQCGVKLPFVPDVLADRKQGVDWTDGYEKGLLRVTLESSAPVTVELHLEDYQPQAVGHNPHQKTVQVEGLRTLDVPIREFAQLPGVGIARPLKSVLQNVADVRIEVRQPGYSGQFRIHRLEVCDVL